MINLLMGRPSVNSISDPGSTRSPSSSSRSKLSSTVSAKGAPGTAAWKGRGHSGNERSLLGGEPSSQKKGADAHRADDDEDAGRHFDYFDDDDEEDEFGLPSISSSRKIMRSAGGPSLDLSRTGISSTKNSSVGTSGSLDETERSSSFDIAEERSTAGSLYARKSEKKILRPQYKDILQGRYPARLHRPRRRPDRTTDPVNSLQSIKYPSAPSSSSPHEVESHTARISRINKFKRILQASSVSLSDLRDSAWSGVPEEVRCITWQFLLGYLPTSADRRVGTLERKRREYLESVRQVFERSGVAPLSPVNGKLLTKSASGRGRGLDENVWHQISIDVPRTSPHIELYGYEATQRSLERILYLWAVRHPASGYVQGINDLVTPFWQVFLGSYITNPDIEGGMDPGQLPKAVIEAVEADCYWCLTKLLDGIQDNYIYAQPGIVRQVGALRDLTHRIDKALAKHLENQGVEFMQFSFRWMNCLLMREVNVKCTIRMWDTYMAEEQGFSEFHLYVCAAFLVKWTDQLLKLDFQVCNAARSDGEYRLSPQSYRRS